MDRYTLAQRVDIVKTLQNDENIAESVTVNPGVSISRSHELDLSTTFLHRISHKNLGLHAYKVRLTQELKPTDHAQGRTFADWVL